MRHGRKGTKAKGIAAGPIITATCGLLISVLLIVVVYFGKPVLVPLALAMLLTFILTPLVVATQRLGMGRVPAVLLVVALTIVIFGIAGWGVAVQLTALARDLPAHATEIRGKIQRVRASASGPFSRVMDAVRDASEPAGESDASNRQQVVAARPTETRGLGSTAALAGKVLEPVATAGLVLILVVFMLIRREDLRNRIIGMLGHTRLTGTTRVLVESAQRVGRLLLMQLTINAAFGVLFGLGLLLIGVPYWLLWGLLVVVFRFVPYIGSWLAAAMPLLLSVATAPGWAQPLMVLGLFLVLDLTTGNVVEPLLFGHSTGVSPVALLIAALFWTWMWGPIGLVLSTPLTVCLVVLGQHVPRLEFLSLLLGDRPALDPHVAFYQRLLAGDKQEAQAVARSYMASLGADRLADGLLLPALLLTRRDRVQAGLASKDEAFVFEAVREILKLTNESHSTANADAAICLTATDSTKLIFGCSAHHASEELTLLMLAAALRPDGCRFEHLSTRVLPSEIESRIASQRPSVVVIAIVPPGGVIQARYLCRRLRKRFADLKIVIGYWGRVQNFDRLLVMLRKAGASYVTTSMEQTRSQIAALFPADAPRLGSTEAEVTDASISVST